MEDHARKHDAGVWQCLCAVVGIDQGQEDAVKETAAPHVSLGFGSSEVHCPPMILERPPTVAHQLIWELEEHPDPPIFHAASSARSLSAVRGFAPPSWQALAAGARPQSREPDDYEPGRVRTRWQHEAASGVEELRREDFFMGVGEDAKVLVRSKGGPGAGLVLSSCPTCRVTKLEHQVVRVVLLRTLRLPPPPPLTGRACRCPCGHHRAACAHAGVLGRREWALENVLIWHCRMSLMGGESFKLWWTGCFFLENGSWPWTPLLCARVVIGVEVGRRSAPVARHFLAQLAGVGMVGARCS